MIQRLSRRLSVCLALLAVATCCFGVMTGAGVRQARASEKVAPVESAADFSSAAPQQVQTAPDSVSTETGSGKPPAGRRVVPAARFPTAPAGAYAGGAGDAVRAGRPLLESSSRAKVYRNVTLAEDTVWSGEVHVNGWVTVPAPVTLTIEAGTVVRFKPDREAAPDGAGLLILGRLVASGRAENQILLSGGYARAVAGDWQGVVLLATDKKNLLEQCRIEGAVTGLEALHSQLALRDVVASNCDTGFRFRDSFTGIAGGGVSGSRLGVHAVDSELEIKDASISSNRKGIVSSYGSLYLYGATLYGNEEAGVTAEGLKLKVSGSSFTVNGLGMRLSGCEGTVSLNRILSNRDAGLELIDSRVKVTGNEVSQNGMVGVRISNGGNVVWGNSLFSNNSHDLEYTGSAELVAMSNWWGDILPDRVPSRIKRGADAGNVLATPVLMQRPRSGF